MRRQWDNQLKWKQEQEALARRENRTYAANTMNSLNAENEHDNRRKREELMRKQRYKQDLEHQVEDTNKKKLYKDVMSEFERKVNSADLAAYENMQADLLNAKLLGVKASSSIPSTNLPNNEEKSKQESTETKPDYSYLKNTAYEPYCARLLEPTVKNMLDPRVVLMRNDTNNLAYGYKQTPGPDKYFYPLYSNAGLVDKSQSEVINPLRSSGIAQVSSPREVKPNMPREYYNSLDIPKNMYDNYKKFDPANKFN